MSTDSALYVPLVTPLTEQGDVCPAGVARLIANTARHATGFIACLTSGEGWLLDETRWEAMLRATLAVAGGPRVIAGIERATTAEVTRYAVKAQALGARAVMFPTPFGKQVTQADMVAHFTAVHDATDLKLYIYNESSLSQNTATLETLLEIARLPRVAGIRTRRPSCAARPTSTARGAGWPTTWAGSTGFATAWNRTARPSRSPISNRPCAGSRRARRTRRCANSSAS
ncbi:dihydrodipicolinate synthase family protein [Burkholderia glumae]|uniref:dihydrodipicolinate synthase family protein n=1 Tax=Burkholderia glumae TaxID=337 RepID=UPI0020B2E6A4|nr:dihydrodipicolinate synthase family protein [Burkholderia glumae]